MGSIVIELMTNHFHSVFDSVFTFLFPSVFICIHHNLSQPPHFVFDLILEPHLVIERRPRSHFLAILHFLIAHQICVGCNRPSVCDENIWDVRIAKKILGAQVN
ncbi:hypothetical protein V8G54_007034 [Vigna mungo]|uniref:Uncharacterized protein n=1 Tax=Vigna mungo TaxID=3915 RepID=A0AAQ3S6Z7_VIGMU